MKIDGIELMAAPEGQGASTLGGIWQYISPLLADFY